MENKRRYWLLLGAVAALVLITVLFLRARQTPPQAGAQPAVSLATVRYGSFEERITVSGRVGAPAGAQTKPAFAVAGVLASIDVRIGQSVHAGQVLAQLDAGGLALGARQAAADAAAAAAGYGGGAIPSAQVRTASAKLELARQKLAALQSGTGSAQSDRTSAQSAVRQAEIRVQSDRQAVAREQQLFAAGVAARKDLDAAQAQLAADTADENAQRSKLAAASTGLAGALAQAQADYAQAQSDLRTAQAQTTVLAQQAVSAGARAAAAQRDYRNTALVSPIDGVIAAIYKHPGESVDSTTAVIGISPAAQDVVTLDVPANESRRVSIGDLVTVRTISGSVSAQGRVTGISSAVDPTTQSTTVVVNATPPGALSGDALDASITVAHDRGLIVAQTAIVADPQTGNTVVFVQTRTKEGDLKFAQHAVRVLKSDGATAEISGLAAGTRVAAQGAFQLLAPAGG